MAGDLTDRRKWTLVGAGAVVMCATVALLAWVGAVCFGGIFGLPPCRTIDAYKIYNNGADEVAGAFRVRKSVFNAIQSNGVAGSCIYADYAAFNLPKINTKDGKCSSDADCHGPLFQIAPSVYWESLCHPKERTCWVRPGDSPPGVPVSVCTKDKNPRNDGWYYYSFFPTAGPFKLATLNGTISGKPILKTEAKGKPLAMRLGACLNGIDTIDTDGGLPPCADEPENRIFQFSEVNNVTLPQ